jgi:hypothetical protein
VIFYARNYFVLCFIMLTNLTKRNILPMQVFSAGRSPLYLLQEEVEQVILIF